MDTDGPVADDLRDYLFEMLSQLAKMAAACGEGGIALVLHTMVASGEKGTDDYEEYEKRKYADSSQ